MFIRRVLAAIVLLAGAAAACAQGYPGKPIRMIIAFAPGGASDVLARVVAHKLTESLDQQVVVENRPGGNTVIGTEALVKAAPDGYTILMAGSSHVTTPLLQSTPYDPIKDFTPIGTVASTELVLVLHPSVPANNLQEVIAVAKSRPGKLNYGSAGSGNSTHMAGEFFNILAGVRMQHIPYKGTGPALSDLIGGQIELCFVSPASSIPFIRNGRIKAIAISGETRLPALPQIPTFTEAGLPGFDVKAWYGLLAPAGTPKETIDRLAGEITRIIAMPDMKEKLAGIGLEPFALSPDRFAALIRAELAKHTRIINAAKITIEN